MKSEIGNLSGFLFEAGVNHGIASYLYSNTSNGREIIANYKAIYKFPAFDRDGIIIAYQQMSNDERPSNILKDEYTNAFLIGYDMMRTWLQNVERGEGPFSSHQTNYFRIVYLQLNMAQFSNESLEDSGYTSCAGKIRY